MGVVAADEDGGGSYRVGTGSCKRAEHSSLHCCVPSEVEVN